MPTSDLSLPTYDQSRRRFVKGLAAGGVVMATQALLEQRVAYGFAQPSTVPQDTLSGRNVDLELVPVELGSR